MSSPKKSHVAALHKRLFQKNSGGSYIKTVEEEFQNSWDWVEGLYQPHPLCEKILPFLQEMRQRGYDKTLRAGQSLWTFMLARSLRHGLQPKQRYLYFHFTEEGMSFGFNDAKEKEISAPEIKWSQDVEQKLVELQKVIIS